jgi:hypothetical protein
MLITVKPDIMIDMTVLKGIYDKKSLRDIAIDIEKSLGTVQQILHRLEDNRMVQNPFQINGQRRAKARIVTDTGIESLRKYGFLPKRS